MYIRRSKSYRVGVTLIESRTQCWFAINIQYTGICRYDEIKSFDTLEFEKIKKNKINNFENIQWFALIIHFSIKSCIFLWPGSILSFNTNKNLVWVTKLWKCNYLLWSKSISCLTLIIHIVWKIRFKLIIAVPKEPRMHPISKEKTGELWARKHWGISELNI